MKIYLPLLYSEKVKRPNKKYFLNNIIGEDFLIILLAFAYPSSHPLANAIGLFCLQIAFWCIYELGYIENDFIGEKFEEKAILSHNYKSYEYCYSSWQPWVWSIALSLVGIVSMNQDLATENLLLSLPANSYGLSINWFLQGIIFWLAFLIILRILFRIYNHINKQSRVWFYLILQALRYGGFLAVISTNIIGLMFVLSSILTRSIQYTIYRYLGGKNSSWPMDFPRYFFCLLIYLLLISVFAANERNLSLLINPHVLLITAFCILRGLKNFYNVFVNFVPVSEDGSSQIN